MKQEVVFREMHNGEEAKVCRAVIDCFNEFVAPDYSKEGVEEFLKYVVPSCMRDRLAQGNFVLVAMDGDILIGVIEVRSNNHISLLFVQKQYQKRGIARHLLKLAIERCRKAENNLEAIDVNSSLYAVSIYEKLGFERVDTEKSVNGIRFVPMKLKLN